MKGVKGAVSSRGRRYWAPDNGILGSALLRRYSGQVRYEGRAGKFIDNTNNAKYDVVMLKRQSLRNNVMTSRQRLQAALNHKPADRVCVDFGAGETGMGAGAVYRLRKALLGDSDYRVKIIEPYQMLGEIDEKLRQALGLDVVGISTRGKYTGNI